MLFQLLAVLLALAAAPAQGAGGDCLQRVQFHMGTLLEVEACGASRRRLWEATERAFARVAALEKALSHYRLDSELSRLLRKGPGWHAVSADLYAAFDASLRWKERTQGVFDVAYAAPAAARRMGLDPERRRVELAAGARIDFGGIGKGIALDQAAAILRETGVPCALVNFGGQVLVYGRPPEAAAWEIRFSAADGPELTAWVLHIASGSVATSGNSERPGHVVDPRTGRSVVGSFSVAVLAPDATSADALSTALFVMGPKQGLLWAETRGVAALFLAPDAPPRPTQAMRPYLDPGSQESATTKEAENEDHDDDVGRSARGFSAGRPAARG